MASEFSDGAVLSAASLNAWISYRMCALRRIAALTLVSQGGGTVLAWDTEDIDRDSMWSTADPGFVYINSSGLWLLSAGFRTAAPAASGEALFVSFVDGAGAVLSASNLTTKAGFTNDYTGTTLLRLAAGAKFRITIFNTGASLALDAAQNPHIVAAKIGDY